MPLYEYACEKCGKVFEVIQKFADEPLKVHEECGGTVDRLLSAPALHFKGSGFYITDYAKGSGSSNSPGKNDGAKSEGGHSEGSKSEGPKSESSSKSESSKSESSKSEGSKSDSGSSKFSPTPATSSSSSDSKS